MASSLFDLSHRVAVVSGAARGMGRAMALALAEHGADLLLVDRNAEGLEQTARHVEESGAVPSRRCATFRTWRRFARYLRGWTASSDRLIFSPTWRAKASWSSPEEMTVEQLRTRLGESGRRPICHVPASGTPHVARGPREHRQYRFPGQHHRPGARPYRLQHGDGGRRANDTRTEYRMGRHAAYASTRSCRRRS